MSVGEDLLNVLPNFSTHIRARTVEWVIRWRTSIGVKTQNDSRKMGIVWLGPTELIVRHGCSGASGNWSTGEILQLTAPAYISYKDIELAIFPKRKHTAIVIAARRLTFITLTWRHRASVILEGAEFDQITIEAESTSTPEETIHAIAKQWDFQIDP
jgi:hypothetical protein